MAMKTTSTFKQLIQVFDKILELQHQWNSQMEEMKLPILAWRFNKDRVDQVCFSGAFDKALSNHQEMIAQADAAITVDSILAARGLGDISSRIKVKDSYIDKLIRYNSGPLNGKVKLSKCLNDLYGLRLIFKDSQPLWLWIEEINAYYQSRGIKNIRAIDASKKVSYKAVHIYFSALPRYPSWEVQLWNPEDAARNRKLHETYKTGYLSHPEKYDEPAQGNPERKE